MENHTLKDLIERYVVKMVEEDLKDDSSTRANTGGNTIITIREHSSLPLLLYLYLLNDDRKVDTVTENHDWQELIDLVDGLHQKNNRLYEEILEYMNKETNAD